MRIAVAQTHIYWEDKKRNIEVARRFTQEAFESLADFIVFPEMSFTGFSMNLEAVKEQEAKDEFSTNEEMKRLSTYYKIHIGYGWVKKGIAACENHYTIVDPEGRIISDYIKIHPFSYGEEHHYFTKGDHLSFCNIKGQKVSTFLCYDLRFPEIFQAASKKAEVIVVAANWPEARKEHFSTLLKARAIENQCYIIASNCVGTMKGDYYSGGSSIITPTGSVIDTIEHEEGLLIAELTEDVEKYRNTFPIKQDRREDLYQRLWLPS